VFYAGMLVVLVPLGLGAGALGALFTAHRDAIVLGASALLVVLGIVQFLGFGFDPARLVPGADAARTRTAQAGGLTKTLLLGATSGVAGMCAGPVLGAVLTLAAARGDVAGAAVMLAIYGAGMVVPLLVIAALWTRLGGRGRAVLRGREIRAGRLRLHTTSMLTGSLMIVVGVVFQATNGLVSVPSLVPTGLVSRLQSSAALGGATADVLAVAGLALLLIGIWFLRDRRRRAEEARHDAHRP
jgi:LPXTG-motif cell wall-anchored protein